MKYTITWQNRLVCVDYFGEIDNQDIQDAHFELNSDGRFYDCRHLILNVSECDLSRVSVPDLDLVIATDLGASVTNKTLNVAMIATNDINIEKVGSYIDRCKRQQYPWTFKILSSLDEAHEWFREELTV